LRTIVIPTKEDTESDRVEALRVLSAGNTLIILCLVGVLLLQVCQHLDARLLGRCVNFCPRGVRSMLDESKPKRRPVLQRNQWSQ
jgi:hypothetical protein